MEKSYDLYHEDLLRLKQDLTTLQTKYGENLSQLALLTKSKLVEIIDNLSVANSNQKVKEDANSLFEKVWATLYRIDEVQEKLDRVIHEITGGEIIQKAHNGVLMQLRDQTWQINILRKDMEAIKLQLFNAVELKKPEKAIEDVKGNVQDFLMHYSRLQDFVQATIPRIEKLFLDIDEEYAKTKKYLLGG